MNENLNLVEILKDCPRGTKFYSPILGEVTFMGINYGFNDIEIIDNNKKSNWDIRHDGRMVIRHINSCINSHIVTDEVIFFPSKDQRDWSKFKAPWLKKPKFDPKTLQPYDKVLVKNSCDNTWCCGFFSHIAVFDDVYRYSTERTLYEKCIPYNDETKQLVGTTDEAPEYYRYWED